VPDTRVRDSVTDAELGSADDCLIHRMLELHGLLQRGLERCLDFGHEPVGKGPRRSERYRYHIRRSLNHFTEGMTQVLEYLLSPLVNEKAQEVADQRVAPFGQLHHQALPSLAGHVLVGERITQFPGTTARFNKRAQIPPDSLYSAFLFRRTEKGVCVDSRDFTLAHLRLFLSYYWAASAQLQPGPHG